MPNVYRRDLSGRVSSCHCNVAGILFFFTGDSLFLQSGGVCPTFTLRQNRCVTSANGNDSDCEQQTGMLVENIRI